MGLDLGALLSGITQGMGSAQDFKLAEQMRLAAEQRGFTQQKELKGMDLQSRKLLELLRQVGSTERTVLTQDAQDRRFNIREENDATALADRIAAQATTAANAEAGRDSRFAAGAPGRASRVEVDRNRAELLKAQTANVGKETPSTNKGRITPTNWEKAVQKRMMAMLQVETEEELATALTGATEESVQAVRGAAEEQLIKQTSPDLLPLAVANALGALPAKEQPATMEDVIRPSLSDLDKMDVVVID